MSPQRPYDAAKYGPEPKFGSPLTEPQAKRLAELEAIIAKGLGRPAGGPDGRGYPPVQPRRKVDTPCALYRFYDASDRLLYVGISEHGPGRWAAHRNGKHWWSDVARSTVEHYPSRDAAMVAELAAIKAECPVYNVAGAS